VGCCAISKSLVELQLTALISSSCMLLGFKCCTQFSAQLRKILFAERVRALESKLPHLQQKLGLQNGNAYDRQTSQVQHSLVGRVEALEEALDVLITAQVGTNKALYLLYLL
jgi:hypothetical protein